jgi:hypothetical protein
MNSSLNQNAVQTYLTIYLYLYVVVGYGTEKKLYGHDTQQPTPDEKLPK